MKKMISIITLLIFTMINSGCYAVEYTKKCIDNQQTADDIADKVVKYINDDDLGELKKLFSEKQQSKDDFDDDEKYFFGCIDGKITSYDINYGGEIGLSVGKDGKIERQTDEILIENVVIEGSEEKYVIRISRCTINTTDRTKEGITSIELRDSDNRKSIATIYAEGS